jgi:hypothetical protein
VITDNVFTLWDQLVIHLTKAYHYTLPISITIIHPSSLSGKCYNLCIAISIH